MSVAVTSYSLDSYSTVPAELCGWIKFARTFGGFSIGFFESPWGAAVGFSASFQTQFATVAVAAVPVLNAHLDGHQLRRKHGNA